MHYLEPLRKDPLGEFLYEHEVPASVRTIEFLVIVEESGKRFANLLLGRY